jgi:hypothetical protein
VPVIKGEPEDIVTEDEPPKDEKRPSLKSKVQELRANMAAKRSLVIESASEKTSDNSSESSDSDS